MSFDLDKSLSDMRDRGYCLIEAVIPPDRVPLIRRSLLSTTDKHRRDGPYQQGISFVPGLINHDQSFAPHLAEPRVMAIVAAMFGPFARISFTSAIINDPGKPRGKWHADWPFNQHNAGHIAAPYPDIVMHLTMLLMLSPFTHDNGGTLVIPASHRQPNNPTGDNGVDPTKPHPHEVHVTGEPGTALLFDSRLWHCPPANPSSDPRVALAVRYAPWWLDLSVLRPGSEQRHAMADETGREENEVPPVPREVFDQLPANVKPLYRHWIALQHE